MQKFSVFSSKVGILKRTFSVFFGFKVGGFLVSHISISPLPVNTSLIVGNLL